jgi:hypothetical protein
MLIAAIDFNVSTTNLIVVPLGVGGGQQNSSNSAGLQPTTQSNLGINAGLVGGFVVTYLGSTSITTGTLGSNYVPREKSNALMLPPYAGSINPSSSTSVAKYINFVKSPYNKWIDCLVGNCNLIFVGLANKAEQYSMAIHQVPTSSIGKMA